jgi:hypothetical protein
MKRTRSARILRPACTVILLCSLLPAQRVPSDFSPFVRLGHLMKVSIYSGPVFDPSGTSVLHPGDLVKEETMKMPVGSGTIISAEGLILTNWHVYQIDPQYEYDPTTRMLRVAEKVGDTMLVYRLHDNDPLKIPVLQYQAVPISLDEGHDTAVLKVVADAEGNEVDIRDFSYVPLGNPFGMKINADLTVLGYPGKGGDTITMTEGKFLGYYRESRFPGLDGFIKTNAAMAPGNSGGAALNELALVGVPTSVTLPSQAGSDLGYIHPVTWALKGFAVAEFKFGLHPPAIPTDWLTSPYNSDETSSNVYIVGEVISANSNRGVDTRVIAARPDRSLEAIRRLHQDLETLATIYMAQQMRDYGLPADEIGRRLELDPARVNEILVYEFSEEDVSEDMRRYVQGEFFYQHTQSDSQGFFILSLPRETQVSFHVMKQGFRPFSRVILTQSGSVQDLGKLNIYGY